MKGMGVSQINGTPKSSILIGFSIINHPFWGYPYFWKHPSETFLGVSGNKNEEAETSGLMWFLTSLYLTKPAKKE